MFSLKLFFWVKAGYKFSKVILDKEYFCKICIHKLRLAKAKNYLDVVTNFLLWLQIFQKTIFAPILTFRTKSGKINKRKHENKYYD